MTMFSYNFVSSLPEALHLLKKTFHPKDIGGEWRVKIFKKKNLFSFRFFLILVVIKYFNKFQINISKVYFVYLNFNPMLSSKAFLLHIKILTICKAQIVDVYFPFAYLNFNHT
jgi:hypothetical protein